MDDLNQKLLALFQLADGLSLPDETVLEEISKKQRSLSAWNEEIVLQGLIAMREFLQDLASQNQAVLANLMYEMDWDYNEISQGELPKRILNLPSELEFPIINFGRYCSVSTR